MTDQELPQQDLKTEEIEYSVLGFDYKAWEMAQTLLFRDFGLNASGVAMLCYERSERVFSVGYHAWDIGRKQNAVFLVTIANCLFRELVDHLIEDLRNFRRCSSPEFQHRRVYGLVAASSAIPEQARKRIYRRGIYLAIVIPGAIELLVPAKFKPKDFGTTAQPLSPTNRRAHNHPPKKITQ
jgi:hypothetical protein